jgi:polyhydroxyalkanoate synthase subunit PhaE
MQNDFMAAMKSGTEQYLKGLNDLGQKFMGASAASNGPSWSEGMEQFAKLYGGNSSNTSHEALFDQLMTQGKAFVGMLEKLYQAGGQTGQVDFTALGQQWLAELSKSNPFMQNAQAFSGQGFGAQFPNMGNFNMPNFNMSNFSMPNMGSFDPSMMSMQHFLNMPSFGLNRESQERQQELIKHIHAYGQAMQGYQELQAKSMQMAVERMQSKLEERSEPGRGLDSLKAVYDLWIDALEEAFAEVAMSSDYQKAYGTLVDAQMRMRGNIQKQIELATGQVGMPTRTELEGVHQKLAEVRRTLRAEVSALKEELAELKASVSGKAAVVKTAPVTVKVMPVVAEQAVLAPAPVSSPASKSTGLLSAAKKMSVAKKAPAKTPAPARKK